MVPLAALWLPILLSAVIVFVASSLMHMLLKYHQGDYRQLPDEDKILAVTKKASPAILFILLAPPAILVIALVLSVLLK